VIRIDVHPTGETWYTWHIRFPRQSTYITCTLPTGNPCTWQPFMKSLTALDRATAPEKKGSCPNPQHVGWLIYGSIPSSSPSHYHWTSRGKVKHLLPTSYIGLLGSYHQHVVITFNTYLRGATHRSLTNTSGGYNLEGVSFPHHTPRPSKPMVLRFSLVALPGLRLTNFNISL
jgi:hypothetical protein